MGAGLCLAQILKDLSLLWDSPMDPAWARWETLVQFPGMTSCLKAAMLSIPLHSGELETEYLKLEISQKIL